MRFSATTKDYLFKQRQQQINPDAAFKTGVKSSSASPSRQSEQPYDFACNDPILEQAKMEEAFYAEQLSSGYQVMQSGMIETAADELNMRLFQAHHQHFGLPEQVEQPHGHMQPEMKQPDEAPDPMQPLMNPMMMPGGW